MSCETVAHQRAASALPPVSIIKPAQPHPDEISADSDYLTNDKDSGYSSLYNSPDGSGKIEAHHKRSRLGPFSPNFRRTEDLKAFSLDIDPAVAARFEEIFPRIELLLLGCLNTSGKRFHPVSIRLAVLGVTEADARPRIAVFCHNNYARLMRRFFARGDVKELCKPIDDSGYAFDVHIINKPPLKHAAQNSLKLDFANSNGVVGEDGKRFTSCGTAIRYQRDDGTTLFATLGGFVKVVGEDGGYSLLGMTVAHIFEDAGDGNDFWPGEDNESIDGSDEYMSSDDEGLQTSPKAATSLDHPLRLDEVDERLISAADSYDMPPTKSSWMEDNAWESLEVKVMAKSGHGKDWALVKVAQAGSPPILLPNYMLRSASPSKPLVYLTDQAPKSPRNGPRSIIISSASGLKYGNLSVSASKTMFSMNGFTDSYFIESSTSFCDGDSGSWVVDSSTYQVHGHLIASDALGGGYVTPLHDSLEEMATLMGAQKAQLPTDIDVLIKMHNVDHDVEPSNRYVSSPMSKFIEEADIRNVPPLPSSGTSSLLGPSGDQNVQQRALRTVDISFEPDLDVLNLTNYASLLDFQPCDFQPPVPLPPETFVIDESIDSAGSNLSRYVFDPFSTVDSGYVSWGNSPQDPETFDESLAEHESMEEHVSSENIEAIYTSMGQPQEAKPGSGNDSAGFDGPLPTLARSDKANPASNILEP